MTVEMLIKLLSEIPKDAIVLTRIDWDSGGIVPNATGVKYDSKNNEVQILDDL